VLVHFIDVGQGDSTLIQTPEQNILIDAGERTAGEGVVEYLKNLNVNYLNIVISTHPHADNMGGLINVMKNISTGEVIDPAVPHTTQTYEDYLVLIDQKNIKFTEGKAGISRDLGGGALMQIIHPLSPSVSDLNNASIVVRLTFGDISFIFSGDAEKKAENEILLRDYNLSATVLKVGHHGSKTSTSASYLSAISPEVAVISCGKDNTYGHPHEETLKLLKDSEIDVYRTDTHGTIVIKTDGQNIYIDTQYIPVDNETEDHEETEPDVKYVGSTKSDKYHYPTCTHAKRILEENRIWFKSIEEAKAAGYKPCGVCKPK
jgi:competence protein ComEC